MSTSPPAPRPPRLGELLERLRAGIDELARALPDRDDPAAPSGEGLQDRIDQRLDSLHRLDHARRSGGATKAALRALLEAVPEADDAIVGFLDRRFGRDPARRLAARAAHQRLRDRLTRPPARDETDTGTALSAIGLALRDLRARLERIEAHEARTAEELARLRVSVEALRARIGALESVPDRPLGDDGV